MSYTGKDICAILKAARSKIATNNNIDYTPIKCHHEGDCLGTCQACEAELKMLNDEIERKISNGEDVHLDGIVSSFL